MWRREWSIVTAARLVGEVLSVWMSTIESKPCTDAGTPLVPGHRNQSRENGTLQESMHTEQGGGKIWWLRLKTRPVLVLFM